MVLLMEEVLIDTANNRKQVEIKNGFELHNLKHISVSQVNKFREAPDVWAAQYLGKQRFPFGAAAVQGKAVEAGVDHGVYNDATDEECIQMVWDTFNSEIMKLPNGGEFFEKKKDVMARMCVVALEQMRPLGKPELPPKGDSQHGFRIPIRFRDGEGGRVNALGFLDYWYPHLDNLVVDLKTTSKAPSDWSLSHGIQAAVYEKAVAKLTGKPAKVKFLYSLTRQKDPFLWLTMEDSDTYMNQFKQTIRTMDKLLSLSGNTQDILDVIPHNPDTFYWNQAGDIAQAIYPQ